MTTNRLCSLLTVAVATLVLVASWSSCDAFTMTPSLTSRTRITALKYQSSSAVGPYDYNSNFYWGGTQPQEQYQYQYQQQQQQWQYNQQKQESQQQQPKPIHGIFLGQEEDKVEKGYQNLVSLSSVFSPSLSPSWMSPTASWPASNSHQARRQLSSSSPTTSSTARGSGFYEHEHPTTAMIPASSYSSYNPPLTFHSPAREPEPTGMFLAKSQPPPLYQTQPYYPPTRMTTMTTTTTRSTNYGDDDYMYYASRPYQPQISSSSAAERWHERQRRLTCSALERQEMMLAMNAFDHINFL